MSEDVAASPEAGAGSGPTPGDAATPAITSTSLFALKPLDDLESRITTWAGALGIAAAIGFTIPNAGRAIAILGGVMGAVMCGLLIWAARRRSRFLAGLAAFLFSMGVPLTFGGTPWLLLGLWLWMRGRPSPAEAAERRRLRQQEVAARRALKRGEPAPSGGPGAGSGSTGRTPPKPSKRYTPPARKR